MVVYSIVSDTVSSQKLDGGKSAGNEAKKILHTAVMHGKPVINVQWNHLRLQSAFHWPFMLVQ